MNTLNYSSLRNNLAQVLDKVNDDHTPVIITRQNGKAAVIISLEDFKSYEETFYLMKSPKNALRLQEAINQVESDKIVKHNLIEK
ncbi:type II toxin-antitoxin system Phd/YefM family antitoxin [Candidatus Tisiphia endosymbiont of Nemotelus uliginosus]|uniref:type II toxin-antitoxin system Phd/YefM family antitoxin n=1 Tax=Candidatus Tisiphia endosymbiont of Nemotelus uliginosus TaxID=3077926 RepID=UPI0035C8E6D2